MPTEYMCALCSKPVSLEEDKIDENGKPVHEDCYAKSLSKPETEESPQQIAR